MAIYFYRVNDEYGCFSNFSKHGFELDRKYWMTSEHYFQAKKFIGNEYEEQVRMSSTPMEAANMGRDRSKTLRKDWEEALTLLHAEKLRGVKMMCQIIKDFKISLIEEGKSRKPCW